MVSAPLQSVQNRRPPVGRKGTFDGRYGCREYSCAVTPQVRQTGNRLSGLAGTAYASLLA